MMELQAFLTAMGVNIASNAIYDFLKELLGSDKQITENDLAQQLERFLSIQNASIVSKDIIKFLAERGDITIEGSHIKAGRAIIMSSEKGTSFTFGHNSVSETPNTRIEAGRGAEIKGTGGAQVRQEEDGSITFWT